MYLVDLLPENYAEERALHLRKAFIIALFVLEKENKEQTFLPIRNVMSISLLSPLIQNIETS